ncbi:MAG: ABC transporter ATP-binding protein [bacterium]|nr:ABC transporter ATP-binding protein [bacterium]
MIEITNLTKTYKGGIKALDNINLTIDSKGMFGLLGANGAGKTTLMRITAGLLQPTTGEISVFGHHLGTLRGKQGAKSVLGYLPQELGLFPTLNAYEFLDYIAILKGINDPKIRRRQVEEAIEKVRLTDAARRPLKTYSGGMKRRAGIAQAILGNPKLLIVDEPTTGLDPEERVRLRNLLSEMAKSCTVILSTHIVEDISYSCNDLAVIRKGQVLYRGTPAEMIGQARGKVWHITTQGEQPNGGLTVVSTLQTQYGVQYRVLGDPSAYASAVPAEPTLEDGYIWLMRQSRGEAPQAAPEREFAL